MRLAGVAVVIVGGLASLPRRIAVRLAAERGGRLARGLSRGSGLLVIGRRSPRALAEGQVATAIERLYLEVTQVTWSTSTAEHRGAQLPTG